MANRILIPPFQSHLRDLYLELIKQRDLGDFEQISTRINAYRSELTDDSHEALRRLMSARISVLRGSPPENMDWIKLSMPNEPWVKAEALSILGVHRFHMGQDLEGAQFFAEACEIFRQIGLSDRQAMAAYNAYIGRLNGGDLPELAEQMRVLTEIENFVRLEVAGDHPELLGMVLREKSRLFHEDQRFHAAFEFAIEAVRLYEVKGPHADFQIALLHAADVGLDLAYEEKARALVERVIPPLEIRVSFPLNFLLWRLGGAEPRPEIYEFIPPCWLKRFDKLKNSHQSLESNKTEMIWKLGESLLYDPQSQRSISLTSASLEGRLIRALLRAKHGKHLLIDLLWPESASMGHLNNRFHRLLNRVNGRIKGLVIFDGQFYKLTRPVHLQ